MKIKLHLLTLLIAFAGCKTLEQKCSDRFPSEVTEVVTETVKTDTIITPWHTVEFVDTTECLPSTDTNFVIKTIYRQLPPDTIYYEYECIDTMIVYRDQEKVNWLIQELKTREVVLEDAKKTRRRLMWGLIGAGAAAVIFLGLWLWGVFKK